MNKELEIQIAVLGTDMAYVRESVDEIKEITSNHRKETNGRIGKLEAKSTFVSGSIYVITIAASSAFAYILTKV